MAGLAFVLSSLPPIRWWSVPLVALMMGLALNLAGMFPLIIALGVGMIFGLPSGLAGLSSSHWRTIHLTEALHWSWPKVAWGMGLGLLPGLTFGGVAGQWVDGLELGLPLGLIIALILGLGRSEAIHTRTIPNHGLRRSVQNALWVGSVAISIIVLLGAIVGLLEGDLVVGLAFGVLVAGTIGLAAGLLAGGAAYLQHITLRLILFKYGVIPWDLVRFLDYTTERIILRRVGNSYTFIHQWLLDYFVRLEGRLPP